ncbi:hypothetical protein NOF79_005624 [Salmonella enterica]|nr:hypothetical protein [Salmonella enterica]
MTGQLLNFKTMFAGLVIVLCSLHAAYGININTCEATSGQVINLKSINLTTDSFTPGSVIYSVTQPVSFTCNTGYGGPLALVLNRNYFSQLYTTLSGMGLGIQLTITKDGRSATFTWDDIKKTTGQGNSPSKNFGNDIPFGAGEKNYNATIKLDFLYTDTYKDNSAIKTIAGGGNALGIKPPGYPASSDVFGFSSFDIRILRNGLGRVDITPSRVSLGHFYTGDKYPSPKEANFTVTAIQALKPAPGAGFTIPLQITFGKNALSVSEGGKALKLVNMDTPGQTNGLLLSIRDDSTSKLITFDTKEDLGNIAINSSLSGRVSGNYTVVVKPAPGDTVKTGRFSAEIPVTVTYN